MIYRKELKKIFVFSFLILISIIVLNSCKSTKYVPEGEFLLADMKIKCDNKEINNSELESTIKQKPNRKILGFRFYLNVYNLVNPEKEQQRDIKRKEKEEAINQRRLAKGKKKVDKFYLTRWLKNIGEAPVIYDETSTDKTITNIKNYLQSQSYYQNHVDYSVNKYSKKKLKIIYDIKTGPSYKIKNIIYDIQDPNIYEIVTNDTINSKIRVNSPFNTDYLQEERERLTKLMKTKGYYYFSINNIHYYADTLSEDQRVELTLSVRKDFDVKNNNNSSYFVQQYINNVYIYTDYNPSLALSNPEEYFNNFDTLKIEGINIIYTKKLKYKAQVLQQSCFIKPGDLYNVENIEKTHIHLSSLKQFKLINIILKQPEEMILNTQKEKYLDAHIYLTPFKKQSYNLELEGNNTSGNYGMLGGLSYLNRNLIRGAQMFTARTNLSFQTMLAEDTVKRYLFNTFEFGAEAKLNVPRLILPFKISSEFIKRHNPKTNIYVNYNFQQRPDYTRSILNSGFAYTWKSGENNYFSHSISPLTVNFVKIFDFNPDFLEQIKHLYIRFAYENQFITSFNYNFVFSNQILTKSRDFSYFWFNFESSGNILNSIYSIAKIPKVDDSYKFMGIEFAQFIKTDFDFRRYNYIGEKQQIIYRTYFGIGIPYGNSKNGLPFTKKYFIGGANDIRAWKVRELGPGSYFNQSLTYDQIADMKIMFNVEYRFPIVSYFKGALFVDAGNIWAIDKNDNRAGALFDFYRFYKEFAVGTGIGARIDLNIFVIRFDFGIPLYDPRLDEGTRWLSAFKDFSFNKITVNFGIGYPF